MENPDKVDQSQDPGASPSAPPGTPNGFGGVYDTIAQYFRDATGGKFNPTMQDVSQWGTNIDANYLNTIRNHIFNVWAPQWTAANPATTTPGPTPGPTTTTQGGPPDAQNSALGPLLQPFTQPAPNWNDSSF